MNKWTPEVGEILKSRIDHENVVDRFAVTVVKGQIVGHLNKGIFYLLLANHRKTCQVEVRGKRINLDDGQGLQVACTL